MRAPSNKMSSSTGTGTACCSKVGIKRGPWTAEEDEILADFVKKEGEGRWRTLPKRAGLQRCGKSCRLRWMNYLRPSVKRGHIAPDEEDLILRLHRLLGNRWSLIAGRIPGRTDNEIKNYWNTHLSKKLIRQGIDPRTHKPLITNYNINNDPDPDPDPNSSNLNDPTNTASIVNIPVLPEITSTSTTPDPAAALENMGQKMEMHEKMTAFGEEDGTLSSFLDSLLNDDGVGTQQDPLITPSSLLQPFDLAFWEAEFPTTTTDRSMNIKY